MNARTRLLTRGNTVIAGLLLVSLLSAAALALDAASVDRNPYGLTAAISAPATTGSSPSVGGTPPDGSSGTVATASKETPKKRCINRSQYRVKVGTTSGAKPTTEGEEVKVVDASGKPVEQPGCYVSFCVDRKPGSDGKSQPPSCTPNRYFTDQESFDAAAENNGTASHEWQTGTLDAINSSEAPDGGFNLLNGVPSSLSQPLLDNFREQKADAQTALSAAEAQANTTRGTLERLKNEQGILCAVVTCESTEMKTLREQLAKEEADAAALRTRLQGLDSSIKTLESTKTADIKTGSTPTPTVPCVSGERCIRTPDGSMGLDKRFTTTFDTSSRCAINPNQPGCPGYRPDGRTDPGPSNPTPTRGGPSNGLGGLGNLMNSLFGPQNPYDPYSCSAFQNLTGSCNQNEFNRPSCMLRIENSNVASQNNPNQPRTMILSWQTQSAREAYLSNVGSVGPSGSMQVQVSGPTRYSMTVRGYPPTGGGYLYSGGYRYGAQPQESTCFVDSNSEQQGGGSGDTLGAPVAQLSCEPKIADVGMKIAISYACQNAKSASASGFSISTAPSSQLAGSAEATIDQPAAGVTAANFGLTCARDNNTHSAQCAVQINKPHIVLVANPSKVRLNGETTIGWVTSGMESCTISSPQLSAFTADNESNKSTSGSVKTPQLKEATTFVLACTTRAGGSRTASITVEIDSNVTSWMRKAVTFLF